MTSSLNLVEKKNEVYKVVREEQVVVIQFTMFIALSDERDILNLTAAELQFIPKVILLGKFARFVEFVWDKLPEHIQADPEVQGYRRCREHYNQPWQRDHIDGPAPYCKDCELCKSN